MAVVAKWLRHKIVNLGIAGSSPVYRPNIFMRMWYISSAAVSKTALWGCDSLRPRHLQACKQVEPATAGAKTGWAASAGFVVS